jgi:hypothetical protein
VRFELTRVLRPYRISSAAHSTALAPLRKLTYISIILHAKSQNNNIGKIKKEGLAFLDSSVDLAGLEPATPKMPS